MSQRLLALEQLRSALLLPVEANQLTHQSAKKRRVDKRSKTVAEKMSAV